MPKLIALQWLDYEMKGRAPGTEFNVASQYEADIFISLGKAKLASVNQMPQPAKAAPAPAPTPTTEQERPKGLIGLREEYWKITGEWPDMRYGTARLKTEVEKLRYERRDMRAED